MCYFIKYYIRVFQTKIYKLLSARILICVLSFWVTCCKLIKTFCEIHKITRFIDLIKIHILIRIYHGNDNEILLVL